VQKKHKLRARDTIIGFVCPLCKEENTTRVIDSRRQPDGSIKRRRKCLRCAKNFETLEFIAAEKDLHRLKILELFRIVILSMQQIRILLSKGPK
jgi:transposase-like protein